MESSQCPWYGDKNLFPKPFGIYSVGRELSHGTVCNFTIEYGLRSDDKTRYKSSSSLCTGIHINDRVVYFFKCMLIPGYKTTCMDAGGV